MAPDAISGARPVACWMPALKKPMRESAASPGLKSLPAKRHSRNSMIGFRKTPSTPFVTSASPSRGNIMKFTEGAFQEWGYELAKQEFSDQIVTERESWILGNKDANPNLTVEQNAEMIDLGMALAPEDYKKKVYAEVKQVLDSIGG